MDKLIFERLKALEKGDSLLTAELDSLIPLGYADKQGNLLEKGRDALEPFRVKRAVIMAAGFGSRMAPITLTTPKPLVRVGEVRFIDTLLQSLIKVGIDDITIVRGYLKEKFDELLLDYPNLKFIDNDKYSAENNISSAVLASGLLKGAYLCEGDFFITGENVIEKYQFESNYLCTSVKETDDWCFDLDASGNAVHYRKGGKNCYQAFGISYWNEKDGSLLANLLKEMYRSIPNKQKFWEMCVFDDYVNRFAIKGRMINGGEIIEVDTIQELRALVESMRLRNNNEGSL